MSTVPDHPMISPVLPRTLAPTTSVRASKILIDGLISVGRPS